MKTITAMCLTLGLFMTAVASAATLNVHPQTALFDQPIAIAIHGLEPDVKVTLTLTTKDVHGNVWGSHAEFFSSLTGTLNLSDTAPFSGTYNCVDPMGLFWSMQPPKSKPKLTFQVFPTNGLQRDAKETYRLIASVGGKEIGSATLTRLLVGPEISRRKIRQGMLYANLYYPSGFEHDGVRHPAVIVLGGSEGGIETAAFVARWLASRGFVALATAWYHIGPLPKNMVDVPVKPVQEALSYLERLPFVNPDAIGAWGGSWGGTLALLSAVHFNQIHAVVSALGPVIVGNGIDRGVPPADYRSVDASPFVYDGKPIPFVTYQVYQKFVETRDQSLINKATIPIWHIHGPILFIAGGDDKLASSGIEASIGMSVLKAHHHPYQDRVAFYPNAGHLIFPGYFPTANWATANPYIPVGGTSTAYGQANEKVGPETITFLRESLH
ncbi:MAG TPA: acyl-CoA thioesterase/bile acid-CoA:amino acid N-acyltransferase family protein [Rhodanobacteraceae bacterium]|nr:acyl-CoA thioesterase/bile acid-CoA:amino acid N-acyltransferase family protein [Rhodanobacteraceae bacterium]